MWSLIALSSLLTHLGIFAGKQEFDSLLLKRIDKKRLKDKQGKIKTRFKFFNAAARQKNARNSMQQVVSEHD